MSVDASWPLQQAVHAALVADTNLSAKVAGRIYDRPPQDVAFPYLTLGDTEMLSQGAGDTDASAHEISVAVWSRANGRREAKEILSAISLALSDQDLPLVGHTLVSLRWTSASLAYDRDADAVKGELRLRAFTQPLA